MANVDLLIDADLLLYKAACGVEKEVRWDEENHMLWSNKEDAWGVIEDNIRSLQNQFEPVDMIFCLTGKGNFRKEVYPDYKGNRLGVRKPLCYADLTYRLKVDYTVRMLEGLEADDIMGILATSPSNRNRIIVSEDKDMRSIPCTLYQKGETVHISKKEADYNHMYQTLVGDQSDNYPGCPGVGPVKARKALDGTHNLWLGVVAEYQNHGLTEDDALVMAQISRICRVEDWDSEKKEAILWTPK